MERARKEQHTGWVYVFRSDEFHAYRGQEVRSEVPVKPEYYIPVAYEDLPGEIEDIEQGT